MKYDKTIIRFDCELDDLEIQKLDDLLKQCYRTRKNFAEALIMLTIQSDGKNIDLTKLGVIK